MLDIGIENIIFDEEANILGSILKDETLIQETSLRPQHFKDPRNRKMYEIMLALIEADKGINTLSLKHIGKTKGAEIGGDEHIREVINSVVSTNEKVFKRSERAIKENFIMEKARDAADTFVKKQGSRLNIKDLEELTNSINNLEAETTEKGITFKETIKERYEYHVDQKTSGLSGVDTGFNSLNKITDGWTGGNLVIIGARPSMGKTAIVINGMLNSDEETFNTFFSLEMTRGELVDRFIAGKGAINLMKMKNPNKFFSDNERARYNSAIGQLEELNLSIRRDNTVSKIRAAIRRNMLDNPNKKHIVYIDYLTLIRSDMQNINNRHLEVERITQDLKDIAMEFGVPIIVLSQLSRALEQRNDKRPIMADLRESGSIEQVADIIMFLYRDAYYTQDQEDRTTEVIIAKNRNGTTGKVNFEFYRETNIFKDGSSY